MANLNNIFIVQTPEGIRFNYQLASPVSRFLAIWIDQMIILVLQNIISLALILTLVISEDLYMSMHLILYFIVTIGYGMFMEWVYRGQTLGKKLFHLRVIDSTGLKLNGSQIVIRNLFRFIDSQPMLYCLGGLVCLFTKQTQRLGDIAGGTLVIYQPKIQQPQLESIMDGKYNTFRNFPTEVARMRQSVPHELAQIGLQALIRRDQIEAENRVELFDDIAEALLNYVKFPDEAFIGLTSEHVARNCVVLLFEDSKKKI